MKNPRKTNLNQIHPIRVHTNIPMYLYVFMCTVAHTEIIHSNIELNSKLVTFSFAGLFVSIIYIYIYTFWYPQSFRKSFVIFISLFSIFKHIFLYSFVCAPGECCCCRFSFFLFYYADHHHQSSTHKRNEKLFKHKIFFSILFFHNFFFIYFVVFFKYINEITKENDTSKRWHSMTWLCIMMYYEILCIRTYIYGMVYAGLQSLKSLVKKCYS